MRNKQLNNACYKIRCYYYYYKSYIFINININKCKIDKEIYKESYFVNIAY